MAVFKAVIQYMKATGRFQPKARAEEELGREIKR
jgi:hypothetical protein